VFLSTGAHHEPLVKPEILATLPSQALQRVTALAARLFSAPISIVSVLDNDKLSLEAYYGDEVEEIARQVDLTSTAAPLDQPFIVEDGRIDPRVKDSPLVTGALGLRFYAGVPLKRESGEVLGTLSVLGFVPGTATADDVANLEDLAALAVAQLELQEFGRRATAESIETVAVTKDDKL
jgi:GAF domain-containing protein